MSSNVNSKRRLLLVDDEHLVLATLAIGLSRAGYIVNTVESVDETEAIANKIGGLPTTLPARLA